jgi:hypothetical protein
MGSAIDLPKFSMSSERIASLYVIKTKAFNKGGCNQLEQL